MAERWPAFPGRGLFGDFSHWDRLFDDFFTASPWEAGVRSVARDSWPPMNVAGTDEAVDVYLFAAGLEPDSIDVSIRSNLLTIAGERKPHEVGSESNFYRRERTAGSFRRVVTLPEDVDPDKVEASYRNGVLHVIVQRKETAKPRRIEVH